MYSPDPWFLNLNKKHFLPRTKPALNKNYPKFFILRNFKLFNSMGNSFPLLKTILNNAKSDLIEGSTWFYHLIIKLFNPGCLL